MFAASKLLSFVVEPLFWVLLPLAVGLLLQLRPGRRQAGLALCWLALALLLLCGWTGLPEQLMRPLEAQYPTIPVDASLQRYHGIVLLGGALSSSALWEDHGHMALNEHAERMTIAVALLHRHPHLQLVFTGGNADILGRGSTEARRARQMFEALGVDPARVRYEDRARNTAENATLTAALPGLDIKAPWLLLTSASHLPRAMGVFRKAGWNVVAYPVDHRATRDPDWLDYSLTNGFAAWRTLLHETIGYQYYRWRGWIE